jgi:hypothetical protein
MGGVVSVRWLNILSGAWGQTTTIRGASTTLTPPGESFFVAVASRG